jgi:hypothetical protein
LPGQYALEDATMLTTCAIESGVNVASVFVSYTLLVVTGNGAGRLLYSLLNSGLDFLIYIRKPVYGQPLQRLPVGGCCSLLAVPAR